MQPVTMPKIVTDNREVNQLQTHVSNALQQVGQGLSQVTFVGEIKKSPLTLAQFQAQGGPGWVACDGSSCVGSDYQRRTGNIKVPTIAAVGVENSFIRIN